MNSVASVRLLSGATDVGVSPFTRMSVFDSPSVNVRVDESLTYVFTPAEISLFGYVSSGIRAVQERGSQTLSDMAMDNPFFRHFERGTAIYQEIEALGPATDLDALGALAMLPEDASEQRERLEREVAALGSDAASGLLAVHREAVRTLKNLEVVAQGAETFEVEQYNDRVVALGTLRESYRQVREETFAPGELPGSADDGWQRFITSAAEYLEHLGATHYPQDGDQCIYCRQPLDPSALSIVLRYATFLDDALGKQISDQQRVIASMAAPLTGLSIDDVDTGLRRQREENPTSSDFGDAEELARSLRTSIRQVRDGERVTCSNLRELAGRVRQKIDPMLAAHESEAAALTEQLADRTTALRAAETALRTLIATIELDRRLPEIRVFVENAKRATKLSQVLKPLTPLLRSLTQESKLASEDLVNSDFQTRFQEECKALRTPTVRLEFIGREGKAQRRKSLTADHRLSQILSEGQQKVLALADFLAEARMGGSSAPIVFDDPVNSLDHRRLKQVSDRIAALVATCQVVVFTHDIWLATELLARFDKRPDECAYYMVSDDQTTGAIGKIDRAAGPRWDSVKALKKRVNDHLQDAAAASGAAQTALVEAAFGQMRSWCEVVVEEVIFGDVSRRYRRQHHDGRASPCAPGTDAGRNQRNRTTLQRRVPVHPGPFAAPAYTWCPTNLSRSASSLERSSRCGRCLSESEQLTIVASAGCHTSYSSASILRPSTSHAIARTSSVGVHHRPLAATRCAHVHGGSLSPRRSSSIIRGCDRYSSSCLLGHTSKGNRFTERASLYEPLPMKRRERTDIAIWPEVKEAP